VLVAILGQLGMNKGNLENVTVTGDPWVFSGHPYGFTGLAGTRGFRRSRKVLCARSIILILIF
jgi:hypothetical protein